MKTNFDVCCESAETMAQIIDVMKCGWTKEQISEWLRKPVVSLTLIRRYRCIKEVAFACYDDNGFAIENKLLTIPVGSEWQETPYMIVGGSGNVHLDRENAEGIEWCEPLKGTLKEYFEEIEPLIL